MLEYHKVSSIVKEVNDDVEFLKTIAAGIAFLLLLLFLPIGW